MNRRKTKDILEKVLQQADLSMLSDEERLHIEELAGRKLSVASDDDAPRPLWYWIRENYLHHVIPNDQDDIYCLKSMFWENNLNPIFLDASALMVAENNPAILANPVTRSGLRRGIVPNLDNGDRLIFSTSAAACHLAGLASLENAMPTLLSILNSEDIEDDEYVENVFRSLLMLGCPDLEEIASRWLREYWLEEGSRFFNSALLWYDLHPEMLSQDTIVEIVNTMATQWSGSEAEHAAASCSHLAERVLSNLTEFHPVAEWSDFFGADYTARLVPKILLAERNADKVVEILATPLADFSADMRLSLELLVTEILDQGDDCQWLIPVLRNVDDNTTICFLLAFIEARTTVPVAEDRLIQLKTMALKNFFIFCGALLATIDNPDVPLERCDFAEGAEEPKSVSLLLNIILALRDHATDEELEFHVTLGMENLSINFCREGLIWVFRTMNRQLPLVLREYQVNKLHTTTYEALTFYTEYPDMLVHFLLNGLSGAYGYAPKLIQLRNLVIAGILGGTSLTAAQSIILPLVEDDELAATICLNLLCENTENIPLADGYQKILLLEQNNLHELMPDDNLSALMLLHGESSYLKKQATKALLRLGEQCEMSLLSSMIPYSDSQGYLERQEDIEKILTDADASELYVLNRLSSVFNGRIDLEDADWLPLILQFPDERIRAAAATCLSRLPPSEVVLEHLFMLLRSGDATAEVISGLCRYYDKLPFLFPFLKSLSCGSEKDRPDKFLMGMAESGDMRLLPSILKIIESTEVFENEKHPFIAIRRLLERTKQSPNPCIFLWAFDIEEIGKYYRVVSFDSQAALISAIMNDEKSECLKVLLTAMEQHSDAEYARSLCGKRILCQCIGDFFDAEALVDAGTLSQSQFEKVLIYLQPTYIDRETGSILCEVKETPTGEILPALFETTNIVVFTAVVT